jgi:hypothetical protein
VVAAAAAEVAGGVLPSTVEARGYRFSVVLNAEAPVVGLRMTPSSSAELAGRHRVQQSVMTTMALQSLAKAVWNVMDKKEDGYQIVVWAPGSVDITVFAQLWQPGSVLPISDKDEAGACRRGPRGGCCPAEPSAFDGEMASLAWVCFSWFLCSGFLRCVRSHRDVLRAVQEPTRSPVRQGNRRVVDILPPVAVYRLSHAGAVRESHCIWRTVVIANPHRRLSSGSTGTHVGNIMPAGDPT